MQEGARSFKARDEELVINIKDGDRGLYRFDAEKDNLFAEKNTARANELLEGATRSFEIALRLDRGRFTLMDYPTRALDVPVRDR